MTTICYRDGILVVDSLVLNNWGRRGSAAKAIIVPSHQHPAADGDRIGSVYASCGLMEAGLAFFEWGRNGEPKGHRSLGDDFAGVIVDYTVGAKPRLRAVESGLIPWAVEGMDYYARGSGAEYAFGAMAHGASALEACSVAAKFDVATGGPLHSYRLNAFGNIIHDGFS